MIEKRGRKLTPGERVSVWVDNLIKMWPIILPLLAGTVYGNSETVRNAISWDEPLPEVKGKIDKPITSINPEVRQKIESIIQELDNLNARVDEISDQDVTGLQEQIDANTALIELWHDL